MKMNPCFALFAVFAVALLGFGLVLLDPPEADAAVVRGVGVGVGVGVRAPIVIAPSRAFGRNFFRPAAIVVAPQRLVGVGYGAQQVQQIVQPVTYSQPLVQQIQQVPVQPVQQIVTGSCPGPAALVQRQVAVDPTVYGCR